MQKEKTYFLVLKNATFSAIFTQIQIIYKHVQEMFKKNEDKEQ